MRFNKGVQEPVFARRPLWDLPDALVQEEKSNYQVGGDVYLLERCL